jgi:hypothetical protein
VGFFVAVFFLNMATRNLQIMDETCMVLLLGKAAPYDQVARGPFFLQEVVIFACL